VFDKLRADVEFLDGNYDVASRMYLDGARDGDAEAAFNYAYCLKNGYGVTRDPKEAKSFYSFAKNLKGGDACYNLAMLYLHGEGVNCNYKLTFEYMRDAADRGCVEAMLYLGMVYTTGCVFEPDIIEISRIPYHKAVMRDFAAPLLSGYVPDLEEDEERRYSVVQPDAREAFLYFRAAARHDPTYAKDLVAKGKFLYAKCYLDGMGVDFDRQKGVRLMLMAGRDGSSEAVAYLEEQGVSRDMLLAAINKK